MKLKPYTISLFKDWHYPYLYAVILIFTLIIRLIGLDKGIWLDEAFTIAKISKENIWEMLKVLASDRHQALYYLLLYLWSKINNSESFLRLFSVVFSIGTIAVVMSWLRQYSRLASVLSGLYLATTPIMLRYSQEMRCYSLFLFATAVAFFFASRIIAKPEKLFGYIGISVGLAIAISTHVLGAMLIAPVFIFIVLTVDFKSKGIHWVKLIAAMAIPGILYGFLYLNDLQSTITEEWWMPSVSWELLSSTVQYMFGVHSLYFSSPVDQVIAIILLIISVIAVVFGNWKKNHPFFIAAITFWLQIIFYSLVIKPIFWYRIILPGLIPFAAFIALQVNTIEIRNFRKLSIFLLVVLSLTFTFEWTTTIAYRPIEYFKKTSKLIEEQWQPGDLVIFYQGYIAGAIRYYWNNIPEENGMPAWHADDLNSMKLEVNKKLDEIGRDGKLKNIILVTRIDLSITEDGYRNILSVIDSEFSYPLKFKNFFVLSHDFCFIGSDKPNNFLEILKSQFGTPLSYQDEKGYIVSEYELHKL